MYKKFLGNFQKYLPNRAVCMVSYKYISFLVDWVNGFLSILFYQNREEIFYFVIKISRIYAVCGVLKTPFKNNNTSGIMVDALEVPHILKKFGCKRAIILNRDEAKNMQSFTIAHELAHFIYDCNEKENFFNAYHISRRNKGNLTEDERKNKEEVNRRNV
jgi:hypothetical protein